MSEPESPSRAPDSLIGGGWPLDVENPRPIRTFTPRYRVSDLTRRRLEDLLPAYRVEQLPLDPEREFGRLAPLVLEIGSGHGGAAIGYAAAHPDHDVLTAEVHLPGVVRMLAVVQEQGLTNVRVYARDAMELLGGGIAPHSLRAVHLFFPDPWPKAKHAKRRFVQRRTLEAIAGVLEPGGELLIGTDHPVYADWTRDQLAAFGPGRVEQIERPAWKDDDGFERKGMAAGRPPLYLRVTFER